jgi:ElaB/YqjD/DUF883 family membrane-anchored ribosome-binding protein
MSNAGNRSGFEQRMGSSSILEGGKEKAKEFASSASDVASQVRDRAQDLASTAASQAQQIAEQAQDLLENVNSFVRRHPLSSIACTLACGMVIGGLLPVILGKRRY